MDRKKVITYSLIGVGASLLTYVLIKKLRKKESSSITSRSGEVEITAINSNQLARSKEHFPAIAMLYNSDKDDLDFYKINYTPRRATTPHNELDNNDLYYLTNPNEIPKEFQDWEKKDQMMHPNDYKILQLKGLIPMNFPLDRVAYVKSADGKNEFIVGFSNEKDVSVRSGKTFKAVVPLWAVSFGQDFNTDSEAPDFIEDEAEFKETLERTLLGEYMLSRSAEGCEAGTNHNMCAAEKNAIMGIILERYKTRKAKRKLKSLTFEDVIMKPQTWNEGATFQSAYKGYPKGVPGYETWRTEERKKIEDFDPKWRRNFKIHYDNDFWHLPSLALNATHYIHQKSMASIPDFISIEGEPLETSNKEIAKKPIKVNEMSGIDRRKTFR